MLDYEEDATEVFPNTDIKGGVAVTLRDEEKNFGPIEVFTKFPELNAIIRKVVHSEGFRPLSSIALSAYSYKLTQKLYEDYPEAKGELSKGHDFDLKSNVLEKLPGIFHKVKPEDSEDYISIFGRANNERVTRYIRREYINSVVNLDAYKLFMSKATGTGSYGEAITPPFIGEPGTGSTETFLSIGNFATRDEAGRALIYTKSKFARALLGVLKVTQDVTPGKWDFVPLQDFTSNSDIDWSKPIPDIDKQLYKKYGLSDDEIEFIETHVKEMN